MKDELLELEWSEKPKKISSELPSEAKLAVIGIADKQNLEFQNFICHSD